MSILKTQGIVLKEVNYGEADKILTIFTKSRGKINASARGARRPNSRMIASTQLMCYSEMVLYKGREMYTLSNADVIEPFYGVREDIVRFAYASYLLDVTNTVVQEEQPASRILRLLLNSLHILSKPGRDPGMVARIFEIRLTLITGFTPIISECTRCGRSMADEAAYVEGAGFSYERCGVLCGNCATLDKNATLILPGTFLSICHVLTSPFEQIFAFSASDKVEAELERIFTKYLQDRFETTFSTLSFLKQVKNTLDT